MRTQRQGSALTRLAQAALAALLLGCMLLVSACGGDAQVQQQATQNKTKLDSLLKHAKDIGVPAASLQPVLKREQQLSSTGAPFTFFNDQPVTDYNKNLSSSYSQLTVQVQNIIDTTTQQTQNQANLDMQTFQTTLTQRRNQGLPIDIFSKQYSDTLTLMNMAQYPKDYNKVSSNAHTSVQGLNLLASTSDRLKTFKTTIDQMNSAHLDVSAMQTQYQTYQQALSQATVPLDFANLNTQIDAQYRQALVRSTQALPYVTAAKLDEFQKQVQLLKTYGMDASTYQAKLDADRAVVKKSMTLKDYTTFSNRVDSDMASMHDDLVKGGASYALKRLQNEANAWNSTHKYHDPFDGHDYIYTGGYGPDGIGYYLDAYLSWAVTTEDYQAVLDQANDTLFNLKMLEADLNDKTPFDQVHQTDLQLLDHYKATKGQTVVVSMVEQVMRIYQDGKLFKVFKVTTGRYERPSLPGFWTVMDRKSPTTFKSSDPPGSPFWYPDTHINYGIVYHSGGFFIHDSWWRADYGANTQFPHYDSSGDQRDSGDGSHGCINMSLPNAQWVYNNTNWQTKIIVY